MPTRDTFIIPEDGYAVGYGRDKGSFRVYISLVLAAVGLAVYILRGSEISLVLAVLFAMSAYYFYPLIETGRARLGANEYGIFIEGFGVVAWRAIESITVHSYAIRTIMRYELHIKLSRDIERAVVVDWRSLPYHRLLMKLPWQMTYDNVLRINLEPFDHRPDQILRALQWYHARYGRMQGMTRT